MGSEWGATDVIRRDACAEPSGRGDMLSRLEPSISGDEETRAGKVSSDSASESMRTVSRSTTGSKEGIRLALSVTKQSRTSARRATGSWGATSSIGLGCVVAIATMRPFRLVAE